MSNDIFNVKITGHVLAKDARTGEILVDKHNDVHPQNMARIIARALAKEPHYYVYRMAFGNGGTFTDSTGQVIFKSPNIGTDGSGYESRLYNETYSEIVDETSSAVGTDPGSSDANNIRPGGGAVPLDDAGTDNTISQEVGTNSNVTITVYLNENEPQGQASSITGASTSTALEDFVFDEIALYTDGAPARDSSGYSTINVGDKTSKDTTTLFASSQYTLDVTVDGVSYSANLKVPSSGTGPNGEITYGDICEGINSGNWIVGGDSINDYVYVYITDTSNGTYPSILSKQSYGFLTFQSKSVGSNSSVSLTCTSGNSNDLVNILTNGICGNANYTEVSGLNAGIANDSITPSNERERLLTHIIFDPITKTASTPIVVIYTLTVSINPNSASVQS